MANEIDELMSMDPLEMAAKDIDAIIAYHRKNRANAEAGIKPKKEAGPKVSLTSLMDKIKAKQGLPATAPAKAPTTGGIRRI